MYHKKTTLGIDENIESMLCYLGIWITGIIFLFLEKENNHVRFNAMQSLLTFFSLFIMSALIVIIPVIGPILSGILTLVGTFIWLLMLYKTYNGELYKLPFVGNIAEDMIFGDHFEKDSEEKN
ncbi:MAG: DUF4870 domain-containing protein [Bacillota bacterium]